MSGVDLFHGWYNPVPLQLTIEHSADMTNMSLRVTDLIISSNSCNDLNALDLNKFKLLQSIEIGDHCFGSGATFKIDGLNRLKSIKIGSNSFTEMNLFKERSGLVLACTSNSFHILNCESLESIEIGQYSFSDFAGEFELKNLPKLQSIQIGNTGSSSLNFYYSSLVIRGIELLLNF